MLFGPIRSVCVAALLVIVPSLTPVAARGGDSSPATDAAVSRGLAFLAASQNADGSFDEVGRPTVAISALSLMSFLANGHVPDRGRYGLLVQQSEDWLVHVAPADGYFGRVDGSRMYGQGIATLVLAQAYGVESDPLRRARLRAVLERSVAVIEKAQDVKPDGSLAGGWRYDPQSTDSDLPLTGLNGMALRACRNIGIDVNSDRTQRAAAFVQRCYRDDQRAFADQPDGDTSIAATGMGMLSLYLLKPGDDNPASGGAKWLVDHPVTGDTPYPYCSMLCATHGAFQAGGATWPAVWKVTQTRLLSTQDRDGGWPQSRTADEPGRVYATAMSVLALSVPYQFLPCFER
jgi:hypothetical protein